VCGDGIINQPSEQCDGAALGVCGSMSPSLACGAPTIGPVACQCCLAPGAMHVAPATLTCCDGSLSQTLNFVFQVDQVCLNLTGRCDPPAVCPLGTCQADHSCCAAQGTACLVFYPSVNFGVTAACCPGFACRSLQGLDVVNCCLPDGAVCTTD